MAAPRITLDFTRREAQRLYEEIGDVPKSRAGPKLLELYRRLDDWLGLDEKTSRNSSGVVVPIGGGR